MLIKYAWWVVHGQGGHIEGLRVGWPSKMSLLVVLPMFTELLRHFCAGWLVRLAGKCVFDRGALFSQKGCLWHFASFSFEQAKENEGEPKIFKC